MKVFLSIAIVNQYSTVRVFLSIQIQKNFKNNLRKKIEFLLYEKSIYSIVLSSHRVSRGDWASIMLDQTQA